MTITLLIVISPIVEQVQIERIFDGIIGETFVIREAFCRLGEDKYAEMAGIRMVTELTTELFHICAGSEPWQDQKIGAMPVWDGIRTLSTLKMKEIWKSIPVVVLADPSEAKDGELSIKLGAEKCIYKPVNTTDLTFLNGTPAQAPGQQIPLQIIFK